MKVLVTGGTGQVGQSLRERVAGQDAGEWLFPGRDELDLLRPQTVDSAIAAAGPDIVVNAAAYTAVDRAEDEPDIAFAANADGAGHVAAAAHRAGARVIHISTDFVFDGAKAEPYAEDDPVSPLSVYGRSKAAGEEAVAAANPAHLIVRTAWVYSPFGRNFLKTMLTLAQTRDTVSVVHDQIGNPTSAFDIADALLAIVGRWRETAGGQTAVYHCAGTGEASWRDFAAEIFAASARLGGPTAEATPIRTDEWPARAKRPAQSRLSSERLFRDFGYRAPDWRRSCRATVEQLLREAAR